MIPVNSREASLPVIIILDLAFDDLPLLVVCSYKSWPVAKRDPML
jgi:hypothetical protein